MSAPSTATIVGPEGFPTPDQIEGFWSFDKMHAPRPITPLSGELIIPGLSWGFTKAQAEYDSPVVVDHKLVNFYYYARFYPHPDDKVVADRVSRYEKTLWDKVPSVGPRWENEWKPMLIEHVIRNKTADWSSLSDDELLNQLQWFMDHMGTQWYVHGHINFALLAASSFTDFYDEVMQPTDTTEAYQCLQGYRTRSVDATQGLWNLSRIIRADAGLKALFSTTSPKALPAALAKTDSGKAFLGKLDEFLFEFGWRSDAVYDMADVTWREDPSIPLAALTTYIELDDSENPEEHFTRSVKRREELMSAIRAKLANDPEKLAKLEKYYADASYNLPLTEDHAFWIDQSGIAVFRRFVLEVGKRLAARGVLSSAEDVHYLYVDELRDSIRNGTDRKGIAAKRRADMAEWSKVTPPPVLGTPPPPEADPFMDAVVVRLLGIRPPDENADPMFIKGTAGSGGKLTGKARVVRSLEEATSIDDGDIVVCEMTLPPWVPLFSIAGAFVTDTGGVLSHCAIVAREFGIPAVVGTMFGTHAIKDGQTITVDGDNGTVTIHA